MRYNIINEVNEIISNYDNQSIEIMNGLDFKQAAMIRTIEFYSSSKYLLGQLDELGKEKPFYNIINGMCDVENAAVDMDTKDIKITADQPQDFDKSFLLTVELQEWMKEADFARVLNEIRDTRTRYGGVLVKKCMEEDEDGKKQLELEVCEWKNLITDPIDIMGGAIIEKHYMSPAELSKKAGVWENVPDAMKLASKTRLSKDRQNQKGSTKRVPIFEVRGEFPQSYFKQAQGEVTTPEDDFKYSYQLYIFAGEQDGKQVLLYSEDDTEKVYKYLARKKKPGRALGLGVVEEGEQAQIWTNDSIQKQQRALEYSSKVVGQTSSRSLKGRNMLTEVENGQILETDDNKPITAVPLIPTGGMQQFEMLTNLWFSQYEKVTSAFAMQRGEVTTKNFRLQSLAIQQSMSLFELLKEEMGIFVGEIFYDWILPYLASQLNKAHILSHQFSSDELKAIDTSYSLNVANSQVIEQILRGELATPEDYEQAKEAALNQIQTSKSHRFFDIPKNYYKDLDCKITIESTGEGKNRAMALESLNNILMAITQNPAVLQDPVATQIFMKIVELSDSGISPISLVGAIQEQAKNMANQQAQMQQQGQMPGQPPQPAPQPQPLSLTASGGR